MTPWFPLPDTSRGQRLGVELKVVFPIFTLSVYDREKYVLQTCSLQ